MKKRVLSALLCLCMVVGMLPAMTTIARAAEAYLWPVPAGKALSRGYGGGHTGLDITSGGNDTNIVATKSGTVVIAYTGCGNYNAWGLGKSCSTATCSFYNKWYDNNESHLTFCNWGYGNGVIIQHSDGSGYSMYGHMSRVNVATGATVRQGDVIGTMGSSGKSTGAHLHFEMSTNIDKRGSYYDPKNYSINNNIGNISYIDQIQPTAPSQNIGNDFYAYIYNTRSNCNLENRNGNVQTARISQNDPRQIWHFIHDSSRGAYKIVNAYDGRCLDVSGGGWDNGTNVQAYNDNGADPQRWWICGPSQSTGYGNSFYLVPSYMGAHQYVLDIPNGHNVASPGTNIQIWENWYRSNGGNFVDAQNFKIIKINNIESVLAENLGSNFYARISYNGAYLQTTGSTTTVSSGRGMDVRLTRTSSTTDKRQIWHFIRQSNGSYKIVNEYSGWCLDVESGVAGNGKNIWTWYDDHGDLPERWYIVYSPGDSSYRIVSAISYPGALYSLDIPGGGTSENANVELYEQNSNAWQYFIITKLSSYPPQTHVHSYTSRVTSPTCTTGGYTTYTCSGCGYSYTGGYTNPLGHHFRVVETTDPTCTERGYTTYTCSRCDDSYVDDYTNALNHNYSAKVTTPTCTGQGFTTHTCSRCGDSYIDNYADALGHSYGEWTVTKPATSTETGQRERTCSRCGNKETETVPAIADTECEHNYSSVVTAPTCFKQGYTTHTCGKCGDSYVDSYINALGHSYTETEVTPTCTERGYTTHICSRCGSSYVDNYTNALGHTYGEWSITTPATANTNGLRERTCSTCGNTERQMIPATGSDGECVHAYSTNVTAPTCTERGYTTHTCSKCGDSYVDTYTAALGHNYSEWTTTVPATATTNGQKERSCSQCGDKQTDIIPATGGSSSNTSSHSSEDSNTPTYRIDVPTKITGGTVKISSTNASAGQRVMITVDSAPNYSLEKLTVADSKNAELILTDEGNGKYTFTMPKSKVSVIAEFQPAEKPWSNPFRDITADMWCYDAVRFANKNGLMNGIDNDLFAPNSSLSRAQLAQILYNREGRPVAEKSSFADVSNEAWYNNAVAWVAEKGIVSGYGNRLFGPGDSITREQLAVMLWRYAGSPAATSKELYFNDAGETSGYALEALCWATENGIISGYSNGQLDPKGEATRAQAAQMLKKFIEG